MHHHIGLAKYVWGVWEVGGGGGACHNHGVIWEESPPASVASVVCGQGSHETSFCGIE